jgi:hypothetical protein
MVIVIEKGIFKCKKYISNKAMPSKNSPTNKAGKTVSTMLNEKSNSILRNEKANFVKCMN